jgi:CRISPR/Cas system-associated protein Cas7 (RAMP superfamily)
LLCVVLFENSEITRIHNLRGNSVEDIYIKTIADQFAHEKKMIVKELTKAGIMAIHSTPEKLTISVVNRYLELKANQVI